MTTRARRTARKILGQGEPVFTMLNSERIDLINGLNWYATNKKYDDSKKYLVDWVSVNVPNMMPKIAKASIYDISNIGFVARMIDNGFSDPVIEEHLRNEVDRIASIEVSDENVAKKTVRRVRVEPPNIMMQEWDECMDAIWDKVADSTVDNISLYDNRKHLDELLQRSITARKEIHEFPKQYKYVREYKRFLKQCIDKVNAFVEAMQVERTRKVAPKKVDPVKMVGKLVLGNDEELKIKTKRATTIVGATKLILWHPERRILTSFVSLNDNGFLVAGRSLRNFDPEKSITKTIRKPEDMWEEVSKLNTANRKHIWLRDKCRTTARPAKALIPDGTVILKT